MAAGREEQAIGKLRLVGEARGQRMRLEVIDGDERLLVHHGDGLRRSEADDDAADQAGSGRRRDAVEGLEARARLRHGARDHEIERFDVGARRNLGHDAAERRMFLDLRQHQIGAHRGGAVVEAFDDRRRRFVAGRFNSQHEHDGSAGRFAFSQAVLMTVRPGRHRVALQGPMAQSQTPFLRIGSRGSPLALAQARETRARLAAAHRVAEDAIAIVTIRTSGDAIQDRPLAEVGGKGLFTKEIEQALEDGAIDLAVHSSKDMPTVLPAGLVLTACLPREDVRDVFISRKAARLADLPHGAIVGTASLRRQAMVKRLRPDIAVVNFRGNVETRLRKLDDGVVDATLLAYAGLKRLGRADAATAVLDIDDFLPAVGQGAIGIETRESDVHTRDAVAAINHPDTLVALSAERAFLAVLDGSCRTPIAGHARIENGAVSFRGMILRPDGSEALETARAGSVADAALLGRDAGRELKSRAPSDFFAAG